MFPRLGSRVSGSFIRVIKCIRSGGKVVTFNGVCDVTTVFAAVSRSGSCLTRRSANRLMPKKERRVSGRPAAEAADTSCPVSTDGSGAVTIAVHAKPGAKRSAVTDVSPETVDVSIAAPPVDGEANAELVRFLAEVLELKKSHVCVDKGSRSRDKRVVVSSSLSPEEVLKRLRQAAD